ncbi:WDR54 protein, partial [Piprites chloris]|nr:WDR54 protein [Piprites chloris]
PVPPGPTSAIPPRGVPVSAATLTSSPRASPLVRHHAATRLHGGGGGPRVSAGGRRAARGSGTGGSGVPGTGRWYRRERALALRSSSSALYNNLAVLCPPARPPRAFGAVHGTTLSLLGPEGPPRQLPARGGGSALSTPLLTQAAWCELPARVLLVLTSQRGVQMYDADGSTLVFWHALDVPEHPAAHSVFARGISVAREHFICVGTSSGAVLVFDIPPKGTNVTLSEVLEQHRDPVTDIAAEQGQALEGAGDLVTADDSGTLCLWSTGEEFTLLGKIPGSGCTCSSVTLWNGIVAAGYGNGQIRLWEAGTGQLRAQVSAHARWIYALDLAPLTGKLLSGAEDSFVHVWKLSRDPDTDDVEIQHCHAECVTDTQVCGARFCDPAGDTFAVTGYDLSEILCY